tara:strand:+ start:2087 stop:3550 length:1464 start_codon:yes stop_codon:yes gene_type:complete
LKVTIVAYTFSEYLCLSPYYLKGFAETNNTIKSKCDITIMDLNSNQYRDYSTGLLNSDDEEDVFMTAEFSDKSGMSWGNNKRFQLIADLILDTDPDVLGFSCFVWNIHFVLRLCKKIKKANPNITIILGGPEFGYTNDEQYLKENSEIDYICHGEGEQTFQEFLLYLLNKDNMDKVQGLAFLRDGKILRTFPRPVLEDLDPIPSPYLTGLINLEEEKHRYIPLETYRGCPFKCSFCEYPKDYGHIIHPFSMKRVEEDLKYILSNNVERLFLMDATFNLPKKRSKDVVRLIIKHRSSNELIPDAETRCDLFDEEFMMLMIEAGWKSIEVGVQSVNPLTLKAIDRPQKLENFMKNCRFWKSNGLNIVTNLILGLPKETYDTYIDGLNFCVDLHSDRIVTSILSVLPNTPLCRDAKKLGIEYSDHAPWTVIQTPDFPKEELEKAWNFYCDFVWAYNKRPITPVDKDGKIVRTYAYGEFNIGTDTRYPWAR